jgi:hypothetical protein
LAQSIFAYSGPKDQDSERNCKNQKRYHDVFSHLSRITPRSFQVQRKRRNKSIKIVFHRETPTSASGTFRTCRDFMRNDMSKELIDRIMSEAEQIIRGRLTGFLDGTLDTKPTRAVA